MDDFRAAARAMHRLAMTLLATFVVGGVARWRQFGRLRRDRVQRWPADTRVRHQDVARRAAGATFFSSSCGKGVIADRHRPGVGTRWARFR